MLLKLHVLYFFCLFEITASSLQSIAHLVANMVPKLALGAPKQAWVPYLQPNGQSTAGLKL